MSWLSKEGPSEQVRHRVNGRQGPPCDGPLSKGAEVGTSMRQCSVSSSSHCLSAQGKFCLSFKAQGARHLLRAALQACLGVPLSLLPLVSL